MNFKPQKDFLYQYHNLFYQYVIICKINQINNFVTLLLHITHHQNQSLFLAVHVYWRTMLMVWSYLCQSKVRRIACSVHHVNTFTKLTQRVSFDRNKNVGNVLDNSKVVFVENDHVHLGKISKCIDMLLLYKSFHLKGILKYFRDSYLYNYHLSL